MVNNNYYHVLAVSLMWLTVSIQLMVSPSNIIRCSLHSTHNTAGLCDQLTAADKTTTLN